MARHQPVPRRCLFSLRQLSDPAQQSTKSTRNSTFQCLNTEGHAAEPGTWTLNGLCVYFYSYLSNEELPCVIQSPF